MYYYNNSVEAQLQAILELNILLLISDVNSAIIITVREHKSESYMYLISIFRKTMDFFRDIEQLKDKFCITSLTQCYLK